MSTTDQPPEHSVGGHRLCCPHRGPRHLLTACIKAVCFSDCVVAQGVVEGPGWAATLLELEPKAVATPRSQVRQFFLECQFRFLIQAADHQTQEEHREDPEDKNLTRTLHV